MTKASTAGTTIAGLGNSASVQTLSQGRAATTPLDQLLLQNQPRQAVGLAAGRHEEFIVPSLLQFSAFLSLFRGYYTALMMVGMAAVGKRMEVWNSI